MTEFHYHRCVKASVGYFEAHGWELVEHYQVDGVDMSLLRHIAIEEEKDE